MPFGNVEPFIIPEITMVKEKGHEILIIPVKPRGDIIHDDAKLLICDTIKGGLLSFDILASSYLLLIRHPIKVLKGLSWLAKSKSLKIFGKNLAIIPKSLWIASLIKEWKPDHIHSYWASTSATVAMIASEIGDIPWSLTAYRWDIAENNLLYQKSMKANFIRVADMRGKKEMEQYVASKNSVVLIHSGVRLSHLRELRTRSNGAFQIVMPAIFVRKKGHTYLIEAVEILTKKGLRIHVDFAGDGALMAHVRALILEKGLENQFSFLGAVSHPSLLEDMKAGRWDVCVLPSIVTETGEKEGIPISLIEALSCGLPAISTNTGGIPELFDGGAGYLIPQRDSKALANAIESLYKNPFLIKQLREAGYRKVVRDFSLDSITDRLLYLFGSN